MYVDYLSVLLTASTDCINLTYLVLQKKPLI